jgi:hypothetical protein
MDVKQMNEILEQVARTRELNRLRQERFYKRHKEVIKVQRREQYKVKREKIKEAKALNDKIQEEKGEYQRIKEFIEKQDLSQGTKKQRLLDTKRFLEKLTSCDKLIDCLQDPTKIINEIKNAKMENGKAYSDNTLKSGIQTILYLIDNYPPLKNNVDKKPFIEFYELMKVKNIQRVEELQADEEQTFDFDEMLNKVKDKYGNESREYLLMSLYNEYTVRDNYAQLLIFDKTVDEKIPDDKNILIMDKDKFQIILNDYKTKNRYGVLNFKLSKKLSNLFFNYINKNKLKHGDYVFGKSKSLVKMVKDILKGVDIDVKQSINALRHSKISTEFKKKDISSDERMTLYKRMGHSPITQVSYLRKLKD